ncbi:hypothetical protein Bca52824_037143 [Brassica carinata]|uniref:DOG1 domain-containing protein n=1 Tax=Brassica carinata TaxID=52824 RepID=A0A8X7S6Y1_BRACI|nr:hypothetical protein Bca52824_037143 [Brassica carinata]
MMLRKHEYNNFVTFCSTDKSEDGTEGTPHKFDQEASTSRHPDKTQRRLAQNRLCSAARDKRLKLIRLEQELDRARQQVLLSLFFFLKYRVDIMMYDNIMLQGFYASKRVDTNALSFSDNMCSGIVAFEMEYGHWVEEQNMQIHELRTVLNGQVSDVEIRLLVDNAMKHYFQLFLMKSAAAKLDVFYIMSGMWKTSALPHFSATHLTSRTKSS